MPVFRFYNIDTGAHFYTASTSERDQALANSTQFVYGVTTSGGSLGGSDSLSQPDRVSQSRTNCLS